MFFSSSRNGSVCDRWMQRGAMSSFEPSTVRKCTFVHDQTGTGAGPEIPRGAPPQFEQLSQKNGTITIFILRYADHGITMKEKIKAKIAQVSIIPRTMR